MKRTRPSRLLLTLTAATIAIAACRGTDRTAAPAADRFASDLAFLRQHTDIVLLSDPSGAQVAVAPGYQGRVMTSTAGDGASFGWIGRTAVAGGQRQPHMNVFGGEDRFWLGPEGGQYSLYFRPGDPFDLSHWQVPEPIDWGAWNSSERSSSSVRFTKRMTLTNYSNTTLDIEVDRAVRLLNGQDAAIHLGTTPGAGIRMVGYESANTVINVGGTAWRPESGLISIWILGMFNPSPQTTIAIPFAPGAEATLGAIVNDAYFGKVPGDRLIVKDGIVFFRGDGQYRSKIGLSPSRARDVAGSYDAAGRVLTLVQYTRPADATRYVNSMWEIQREPYKGDVINSYNDGPPAPGQPPLGPFYELETSSPALSLAPQERYTHVHRTFHFAGPEAELDRLARATLGVGVAEVAAAFAGGRK
jgi:hypothetical protein